MSVENKKVGFIGGGNMAEAMIGGLLKSGTCNAKNLCASDVSRERRNHLETVFGIGTTEDNCSVFDSCDIVVLAVKPQVMDSVLNGIRSDCAPEAKNGSGRLVISIAAGVTTAHIEKFLAPQVPLPVIRVMPNTPALVQCAMCGMFANRHADESHRADARAILASIGMVMEFDDESFLDVVTALSGSGPAYIFYMAECMVKAGVSLGLSGQDAFTLTLQTMKGAVKLMENSDDPPEELRRRVTSPGGTTEAALGVMMKNRFEETITEAITAACKKSTELSGTNNV